MLARAGGACPGRGRGRRAPLALAPPRRTVPAAPPRAVGPGAVLSARAPTPSPAPCRRAEPQRAGRLSGTAPGEVHSGGDRVFQEVGDRRCREHSSLSLFPHGWDALPDPPRQTDHGTALGRIRGKPRAIDPASPRTAESRPGARGHPPPHPRSRVRGAPGTRGRGAARGTSPGKGRTGRARAASAPSPRGNPGERCVSPAPSARLPPPGSNGSHLPWQTRERMAPAPRSFNADGGGRDRSPPGPRAAPAAGCCRARPGLAPSAPGPRRRPHPPRRSRLCRSSCGLPPRRLPPPRHLPRVPALRPIRRRPAPRGGSRGSAGPGEAVLGPPRPARPGPGPGPLPGGARLLEQLGAKAAAVPPAAYSSAGTAGASHQPSSAAPGAQKLGEQSNAHRPPGVTIQWHFAQKGNLFFFEHYRITGGNQSLFIFFCRSEVA